MFVGIIFISSIIVLSCITFIFFKVMPYLDISLLSYVESVIGFSFLI